MPKHTNKGKASKGKKPFPGAAAPFKKKNDKNKGKKR